MASVRIDARSAARPGGVARGERGDRGQRPRADRATLTRGSGSPPWRGVIFLRPDSETACNFRDSEQTGFRLTLQAFDPVR